MKRLLLTIVLLFISLPAMAATYYVETFGGTTTQCNGTADVSYAAAGGVGTNLNCAWNHPRIALGSECGSAGASCVTPRRIAGGDTLIIGPGQYMVGYDTVNIIPGSSTSWPYDATMGNIPSGPDSGHPTRILGKGYDTLTGAMPQLWGNERVSSVLNVNGNNIDVEYLEITDHSACGVNAPANKTIDGFPSQCARSAYPYGPYGDIGILWSGTGNTFRYVYSHGMGTYGWETPTTSTFGTNTFDHILSNGNPFGGWDTGQATNGTGTTTFLVPTIEFNGCQSHYPLVTADLSSSTNYTNCAGQGQVGNAADGISFGANGQVLAGGNWVIQGGSLSFNMGDGFDTLHGPGGTAKITRVKSEGNGGSQLKPNGTLVYIENNNILGSCAWWKNSGMLATTCGAAGSEGANGAVCNPQPAVDYCRANGDVLSIFVSGGSTHYIYNNTITSVGNVMVLTAAAGTCDSGTRVYGRNNIFYGGRVFDQDSTIVPSGQNSITDAFYNSGLTGNGDGSCGAVPWDSDYNTYFGTKNNNEDCTGLHDKCNSNPVFTGTFAMGPTTYYSGTALASLIYLQASSPAINAGVNTLTYQDGSNDFNNFPRTLNYDIGGLEFGSVVTGSNCGNGTIESGESCDGSNLNGNDCTTIGLGFNGGSLTCSSSCSFNTSQCTLPTTPVCGNGTLESPEQCDDHNTTNGDCCSALCETEISGLEKLLTYSKSDAGGNLTVTTHKVVVANMARNVNDTLTHDGGASHFGDFTHTFEADITSCVAPNGTCDAAVWALSSAAQSSLRTMVTGLDGISLEFYQQAVEDGGNNQWQLCIQATGLCSVFNDSALPLTRYVKIIRSGTNITATLYSDSNYSTIVGTMTATTASTAYRYFYPMMSYNDGNTDAQINYTVQNINIGESITTCQSGSLISSSSGNAKIMNRCMARGRFRLQ